MREILRTEDWTRLFAAAAEFGFAKLEYRHPNVDFMEGHLQTRGFAHRIRWPYRNLDDLLNGFDTIQRVIDEKHKMQPWTRVTYEGGCLFGFFREEDAVLFRMLLG